MTTASIIYWISYPMKIKLSSVQVISIQTYWNNDQTLPTNEFLDSPSCHLLLPHIAQPTRMRNNSKTVIDNIYLNVITPNNIPSNLTDTIYDLFSQYFIACYIFSNPSSTKLNIFERDWSQFDQGSFILECLFVDLGNSVNGNPDQSLFNSILNVYAPLKKIKFRNKPSITLDLQKSVSIKNQLLTKYMKVKDEAQMRYKQYRNLLSTIIYKKKDSILKIISKIT